MTHPYSIFIYQAPRNLHGSGKWIEQVQVFTEEYAIYLGGLIHKDNRSVIKVVRYLRFVCSKTGKTGEEQQQDVGSADN